VLNMTMEILTGPERRRRWSVEEKARIIAEAQVPGVRVADIARRHGISRSLLYTWCREHPCAVLPDLVPVVVEMPDSPTARRDAASSAVPREPDGSIEIALASGVRVTVRGRVDPKGLRAVLAALRPA
jgi:transposase